MRALLLTNEFPPEIYGGAGVHVDELTRHLRPLVELDIRTFGTTEEASVGWRVQGYPPAHVLDQADEQLRPMLAALSRGLSMVADPIRADVVHAHTWYTHFPGLLVRRAHGIPLVLTVHDLTNPHLSDQAPHEAALDVLVPAASAVVTLTPGAAAEIARRWSFGRTRIP